MWIKDEGNLEWLVEEVSNEYYQLQQRKASFTCLNPWYLVLLREGNGNPLQYSYLENPMDRGAWWATVHRVSKSRTWLSDFSSSLSLSKRLQLASIWNLINRMDLDHEDLDNIENELGQPALLPRLILPVSPLMAGMAVADLPDMCPLASHEMVLLFYPCHWRSD